MRIQKYCSEHGICSRREAEDYIRRGLIKVNGKVVRELGTQIDPQKDKIQVIAARTNASNSQKMTVLCYKPRGYTCSKSRTEGPSIFSLFPEWAHLNTVGRLDKASEGLLLLSNDGRITKVVTGIDHKIEKEYEVDVREEVTKDKLRLFDVGVMIDDIKTLPAKTKFLGSHKFSIILKEGRKHQIRRMTDVVQWTVTKLKRVRIGFFTTRGLELGTGRVLNEKEVAMIIKSK